MQDESFEDDFRLQLYKDYTQQFSVLHCQLLISELDSSLKLTFVEGILLGESSSTFKQGLDFEISTNIGCIVILSLFLRAQDRAQVFSQEFGLADYKWACFYN